VTGKGNYVSSDEVYTMYDPEIIASFFTSVKEYSSTGNKLLSFVEINEDFYAVFINSSGDINCFLRLGNDVIFVKPAGGGGQLRGRDGFDNTQIGIESFGLANSSKEQLIKLAAKSDGSINNMKYVKGVKVVGKVAVVGSVALTGYQTYNDIQNGNYYSAATRAAVLGIGLAATAIPVA